MYLVSAPFYSPFLRWACLICIFAQVVPFLVVDIGGGLRYSQHKLPRPVVAAYQFAQPPAAKACNWMKDKCKKQSDTKLPSLHAAIYWLLLVLLTLLTHVAAAVCIMVAGTVGLLLSAASLLCGCFLVLSKLMTCRKLRQWWLDTWVVERSGGGRGDNSAANQGRTQWLILAELFLESIPQLGIQMYNNSLAGLTAVALVSCTVSAYFILDYLYQIGHHLLIKKEKTLSTLELDNGLLHKIFDKVAKKCCERFQRRAGGGFAKACIVIGL
ncbi:hypothetical protein GPECTOR_133g612 [Gonium pectorale]|uniref:Uncharacterized protein n=1 Tax=Gonium pectorale TaxID=33097 RepID=A0A150FY75_GONPE|nr:hypothetical protein GPECTOR_133g612 [Gonium pectorale]|eukprot:KXZ42573.1 hypothetical protein GPECTOR_133g612 [Gonium pectorale]